MSGEYRASARLRPQSNPWWTWPMVDCAWLSSLVQRTELYNALLCVKQEDAATKRCHHVELAIIIEEDLPPVAPAHLLGRHRVASVVGQADHSVCLLSIRSDNDGTNFNLYPKLPLTLSHLIAKGERSSEAKEITGL